MSKSAKGAKKGNAPKTREAFATNTRVVIGGLRSFDVPVLDDDGTESTATVHYHAQVTIGELADIQRELPFQLDDPRNGTEGMVVMAWRRALDDMGNRLWPGADGLEAVRAMPAKTVEAIVLGMAEDEEVKPPDPIQPQS